MKIRICHKTMLMGVFMLLIAILCPHANLHAGATYYYVAVKDLNFTDGSLPAGEATGTGFEEWHYHYRSNSDFIQPYAVGDHGEEVYLWSDELMIGWRLFRPFDENLQHLFMAVCAEGEPVPSGKIYLPRSEPEDMLVLGFNLEGVKPACEAEALRFHFFMAKEQHYDALLQRQCPGAAWFRHQRDAARQAQERKGDGPDAGGATAHDRAMDDLQRTIDFFSGGRALSENLRLDQGLDVLDDAADSTVLLDSISGITTREMDWKSMIEKQPPEKDALARAVPFDQHAVFFASFQDMITVSDEADSSGTLILNVVEPRAEDARTRDRYEEQLCLTASALSRLLGPALIASVAFTGSDPYLRTGSDVAVLFEAINADLLEAAIAARQAESLSSHTAAKAVSGTVAGGVSYKGVLSPHRKVCSYMAVVHEVVVVSNSLVQLDRVIETLKGEAPSLAGLDEYAFFRTRYGKGEGDETAFLIVPDAAIRRWCGPRWRIGDSRRTRAAAVMAELQARHLDELSKGEIAVPRSLDAKERVPGMGDLVLDARGVHSSVYGSLDFLTPVAELNFDTVSDEEKQAYESFRNQYMRQWRQYFDPIAARLDVKPDRMSADLTVMPLIFGSEYRDFMEFTGNMRVPEGAGDPHPEAALHMVMAFDPKSEGLREIRSYATGMLPSALSDPLSWVGRWFALYLDEDPFWDEVRSAYDEGGWESLGDFMEANITRAPIAIHLDATNALSLTAFLTALRAFSEQAAPGMAVWETLKQGEQPFVKISATETAHAMAGATDTGDSEWSLYYVPMPDRLIVSLNESTLKRAIDRAQAAKAFDPAKASSRKAAEAPWTNQSMGILMKKSVWLMLQALFNEEFRAALERGSWNNIAALNEWRRVFHAKDPVAFHRKYWQVSLQCPGGGGYQWNETYQTYESTVFGHPGEPKDLGRQALPLLELESADFGLTFENNGLRAKAALHR